MHLLESYSLSTGLKIGKPWIYKKFFPLPFDEKYITLQPFSKGPAKNYKYWQDVIDIIFRPLQENGIRIVQLGLPNEPIINGCVDLRGRTSFNQLSYLVGNAEMHVGADSCCTHFASGENKKIVSLYSIMPDKNCGPYWSDRRDVCCINAKRKAKKKPSYNYLSDDNTINQISPEDISENIFKLLDIFNPYPFKTIYTGNLYQDRRVHLVPYEFVTNVGELGVDSLIIRMDLEFNEEVLKNQLQISQCSIITDKEIEISLLSENKKNIKEFVYLVSKETNPEYFTKLIEAGCKFQLMTMLDDKDFNEIKLDYLDFGAIQKYPKSSRAEVEKLIKHKNLSNIFFKSTTLYIIQGSIYGFPLRSLNNVPLPNLDSNTPVTIVDHPKFWENLSHMTLLEKA